MKVKIQPKQVLIFDKVLNSMGMIYKNNLDGLILIVEILQSSFVCGGFCQ